MTNLSTEILPMTLEFEQLPPEAISLSPSQINLAVELSDKIKDESKQWQTYLNALSLSAFETWLESRGNSFSCSMFASIPRIFISFPMLFWMLLTSATETLYQTVSNPI